MDFRLIRRINQRACTIRGLLVKKKNYGLWLLASGLWLVVADSINNSAFANTPVLLTQNQALKNGLSSTSSEPSLELLTIQLLQDLPSYANRVTQRARRRSRSSNIYSYVLLAGKPEFQPLPINSAGYNANGQKSTATGVEQVFFTTLERQYIAGKIVESQQFHWLLLTKSKTGWRLVMMFTQIAGDSQQVISPPRDSSKGVIAQAVKTWLRDCQAGSVRMRSGI